MKQWTAVVMAAGKGTRMHSRTPKVLHKIAGVPMVTHVIKAVKQLDHDSMVAVVSPSDHSLIAEAAGDGVECVDQPEPLGTGNALATAIPTLSSDCKYILLVNGDLPLIRQETLHKLICSHLDNVATITLLTSLLPVKQATGLGVVKRGDDGMPESITEADERTAPYEGAVEINVGAYCFSLDWLRETIGSLKIHPNGEFQVTDLVSKAFADNQKVSGFILEDPAEGLGVNDRAQLACAEAGMQSRLRLDWMERGVTMEDPLTTYLESEVQLSEDVRILPNTFLKGNTSVGRGSAIGPNAVCLNTSIGENCLVRNATLEGTVIESNVDIGPYCYLRLGTYIENGTHIGSHVEIKNSRIGANSNLGHFSYIGDATLGPRVNIGAGTVTCNYDGKQKHHTEIGADAFIGSDSMLVAPVKIGDRAITGAGSVVTKDIPPDSVVAGVPAHELSESKFESRKTNT